MNRVGDSEFAEMIVGDTIRAAHTDPLCAKDATVQDCLDALRGPQGNSLVQAMVVQYTLAGKEVRPGESTLMDERLVGRSLNIYVPALLRQLDAQLQEYLNLSDAERLQRVQLLIGLEESQDVSFRSLASASKR